MRASGWEAIGPSYAILCHAAPSGARRDLSVAAEGVEPAELALVRHLAAAPAPLPEPRGRVFHPVFLPARNDAMVSRHKAFAPLA
jgi:hypothetical protein